MSRATMHDQEIRRAIRSFILTNFLPGEAAETLKDSTLLLSNGVITSLSMLELVTFIEETFSVTFAPDDFGVDRMDSIDLLVELVVGRVRSRSDSTGTSG